MFLLLYTNRKEETKARALLFFLGFLQIKTSAKDIFFFVGEVPFPFGQAGSCDTTSQKARVPYSSPF